MKKVVSIVLVMLAFAVISVPAMAQTVVPPPATGQQMYLPVITSITSTGSVGGTSVLPSPTSTLPPATTIIYIPAI